MNRLRVDALVAEIGSTTTKINAFSLGRDHEAGAPRLLGHGHGRTTVLDGDVTIGLKDAMSSLAAGLGVSDVEYDTMLASSSAAGGLRMTVHGLVYDMTVRAAKEAALGAGAIVKMVTAGRLGDSDLEQIALVRPNIILLAGGVDFGERSTCVYNAERIASLASPGIGAPLKAPVLYAGNVAARDEIEGILRREGLKVISVENVYPRIDDLNVEPARAAIQRVFEEHIVSAPGMEKIREMVNGPIVPTPGAVMNAAVLLYREIEDLMVLDVGGATTDVHSVTGGSEEINRILINPEPLAKRTVEGDLGVFVNAANVAERIGWGTLSSELGFDAAAALRTMTAEGRPFPSNRDETAFLGRLTRECVLTAVSRHAGRIRHLYGPAGRTTVAEGKDLSRVKWIVGTGGALTRLQGGAAVLRELSGGGHRDALYPRSAEVLIDRDYIMAACGVLGMRFPQEAVALMRHSLA
ncbi:MAG: GlmL-related ornithine degradation protein [Ignavibacteriales bacterium]